MQNGDLISILSPADVILVSHLGFSPIKIGNFCKDGYHKRIWTHVALYVGDGDIVEAIPNGIIKRKLREAYLDGKTGLKVLRKKHLTPETAGRIVNFCAQTPGEPYDSRALIFFPLANLLPPSLSFILTPGYLGHFFKVKNSYFCSELVSTGFKQADSYCFEREPFQVMPVDFDNDLLFDEITRVYMMGEKSQGKFRMLLLQIVYILAAVLVFVISLFILLLAIFIAVITFKRFWPNQLKETLDAKKTIGTGN